MSNNPIENKNKPPSSIPSDALSDAQLKILVESDDSEDMNSIDKINRETARLQWQEIEPHFASGNVISVAKELDLIAVAKAVADDKAVAIKQWMEEQQVIPTSDDQAIAWQKGNTEFWAVVIKPLILIQPI
ncbi:MAG: hypothetical protein ACJA0C_000597 [Candidatus Endobugula sp.]|jgi:hypothetical protein